MASQIGRDTQPASEAHSKLQFRNACSYFHLELYELWRQGPWVNKKRRESQASIRNEHHDWWTCGVLAGRGQMAPRRYR